MATIAVFIDAEEGHILPSFWLLRYLKAQGYRVCYLGPPDAGNLVQNQGFEFIPIMCDIVPEASWSGEPERQGPQLNGVGDLYFGPLVRGELLDRVIAELNPSVVLVLSLYYVVGLAIHYRYQLPVVFFTPTFRIIPRTQECENVVTALLNLRSGVTELVELLTKAKVVFRNLRDIAELVLRIPELVLLPEALDLPGRVMEPGVHYLGAGVDMGRSEAPFSWNGIDSNRPVIYCARGSQVHLQKEPSRRFFQAAIAAAAARPDWQFIIAISNAFEATDFADVPPNTMLREWAPQLEVLSRASVMVNHGGFGTVKECILMGVPMVAIPLIGFRDHVPCAERIVHHGLGAQSDTDRITSSELVLLIEQVISDQSFKHRVNLMREKFMREDRLEVAVKVIEAAISESCERR